MTERDVDRLVRDPSIVRNRAKIRATIDNARAMRSASPSLAALARAYESTRQRAPRSIADLPTSTSQADALAKQLKAQGYRFVGPTSVYAFMQNVGVINDHVHGCFRAIDASARRPCPVDPEATNARAAARASGTRGRAR
jgi:DNA-3-methyladenine glycosylase I